MANMTIETLKGKTVAFAILTGEGKKGKKDENEYVLAVEVTKKEKNSLIADLTDFFNEHKSPKTKQPAYAFEKWFTESKTTKGGFVFWASEVISKDITRKVAPGSGYGMKEFEKIGAGSVVDAECRFFHFNNSYGEGLGMRLSAVLLKEFTEYAGAGGASLEGETLKADGVQVASKEDPIVEEFLESIEDEDHDEGKDLLKSLKDHPRYKEFKKMLKSIK